LHTHIGGNPQHPPPGGLYVHSRPESQTASEHAIGLGFLTSLHCILGPAGARVVDVVVEDVLVEDVVDVEVVEDVVVEVVEDVVDVEVVEDVLVEVVVDVVVVDAVAVWVSPMHPHIRASVSMARTVFSVFIVK
jgi:hypothetical protein